MNKTKFLELVRNPDLIEEKDLTKLDELISEHPYSQIIHVLNVKGRKAYGKTDVEQLLNLAATYTYDRNILRNIIEGPELNESSPQESAMEAESEESGVEETSDFDWVQQDDDDDIFVDQIPEIAPTIAASVADDAGVESPDTSEEVKDEKSTEEVSAEAAVTEKEIIREAPETETPAQTPTRKEAEEEKEEPAKMAATKESEKEEADQTATAEEAPEHMDDTAIQEEPEVQQVDDGKEAASGEATEPGEEDSQADPLALEIEAGSIHAELLKNLNELQESKQALSDQSDKNGGAKSQEEQIEIIDNFIKNSPVLSKPNLNAESEGTSQDDLSKNSTMLGEEIVSENLAKIYLKQGRRKDAEKIYKKLIRKFPQKKGYFADQIQKLKKK